jgi:hypothetical protein
MRVRRSILALSLVALLLGTAVVRLTDDSLFDCPYTVYAFGTNVVLYALSH